MQLIFYAFVMSLTSFILVINQLFYFDPCLNCDQVGMLYFNNMLFYLILKQFDQKS